MPQGFRSGQVNFEGNWIGRSPRMKFRPDLGIGWIVERVVLFGNLVGRVFSRAGFMEEMGRQRLGVLRGRLQVRETFIEDKDPLVVHLYAGAKEILAKMYICQENSCLRYWYLPLWDAFDQHRFLAQSVFHHQPGKNVPKIVLVLNDVALVQLVCAPAD